MSYLIEILVPVGDDSRPALQSIRNELTRAFGGVTMHINAAAEGLWEQEDTVERDRIVVVEVMTEELDRDWWASYRKDLESRLAQEAIVIRSTAIERL